MDDFYCNYERVKQVMALAPQLRVKKLDSYDYAVLLYLASKMAHETLPGTLTVIDTCFPKKETIAEGAVCRVRRVGAAIASLDREGFIKVHKWEDRRGVKHNRYQLVPEVWDNAFTPKVLDEPVAGSATIPTISAAELAADQSVLDSLDMRPTSKPAHKDSKPASADDKYDQTEATVALIRTHFPDHVTFKEKDATRIMTSKVRACIDIAGSGDLCMEILENTFDDEAICLAVKTSRKLGGYIEAAFPDWLAKFKGL